MGTRYLAFDIETAKDIPGEDFNWKPHRPLGIKCIASQSTECDEPRIWLTRTEPGTPAPQMSRADVAAFVQYLSSAVTDGFVPLSWNGLSFDFDVLAEESGLLETCKTLARKHVDMMFHVVCEKGFSVALKSAASGLGAEGKLAGVEGIDAPSLWASGQYDLVTDYVGQDVRTTLAVALKSEAQRSFAWTTRRGTVSSMPLPQGWLRVELAARLPLPDTSWMSAPLSRDDFMTWL
ncbi:MAG: ribonuclease H-like domain-containing protein [Planctomycetota bacterium]|nr:ribonuclease H-like domain-containing protein [Planctomycetota bacterium]